MFVDKGKVEVVRLSSTKGPVLYRDVTENEWTPLGLASNKGHIEVVKLLLDKTPLSCLILTMAVEHCSMPLPRE